MIRIRRRAEQEVDDQRERASRRARSPVASRRAARIPCPAGPAGRRAPLRRAGRGAAPRRAADAQARDREATGPDDASAHTNAASRDSGARIQCAGLSAASDVSPAHRPRRPMGAPRRSGTNSGADTSPRKGICRPAAARDYSARTMSATPDRSTAASRSLSSSASVPAARPADRIASACVDARNVNVTVSLSAPADPAL